MENYIKTNYTCAKCYKMFVKDEHLYLLARPKQSDVAYHMNCIPTETEIGEVSSCIYHEKGQVTLSRTV